MVSRSRPQPPSISQRIGGVVGNQADVTSDPTGTDHEQFRFAEQAFRGVQQRLRALLAHDLGGLEAELEALGAPWTPGRLPEY